ncbi:MAG: TIGR02221 family CRISPR-associated protein [Bacteroidales bacterium]|nr:TIGR02221 family CRISPR-associated protein [Bacteroidales bacterium]
MAKILISSLGTGRYKARGEYEPTTYKFQDSDKLYSTSFVATALSEHLQVDRLYLIGTSKSMWDEVYQYFTNASDYPFNEEYWAELGERVISYKLGQEKINADELREVNNAIDAYLKFLKSSATGGSQCFIIDYGINESEVWQNFDLFMRIGEDITENDEVYLDITHGFRSIPLFNYLMLDLISILKFKNNFKLAGLFYGMLDVSREIGYTPIVDLSPLYNITLWTRGAYNFINFGNGYQLADVIDNPSISGKISDISDMANLNYVKDFKMEVDRLEFLLSQQQTTEHIIKYMQPYLGQFISYFKGVSSSSELQLVLAKWYFENKRFSQAYICLAESIISKLLEIYREKDVSIGWTLSNRKKIKDLIFNYLQNSEFSNIHKEYDIINRRRNKIAHAGFLDGDTYKTCIEDFCNKLNNVERYVFKNNALKKIPELFSFNRLRAY